MLEFVGPVSAQSALQTELLALEQMLKMLNNAKWCSERILILSDSVQLVESVHNARFDSGLDSLWNRVTVRYINRVFNMQADRLAKYGAGLDKLWSR